MSAILGTPDVVKRLRAIRKQRRMSVQQVSDRCSELGVQIHRSVLAKLENGGRTTLRLDELKAICEALGVDPREVITDAPLVVVPAVYV